MERLTTAQALREVAAQLEHDAEYNINETWRMSEEDQRSNNRRINQARELQARADDLERQPNAPHRGPSTFSVFGFIALPTTDVRGASMSEQGLFRTIEEARESVRSGGLTHWEIWLGDHIVAESDHEGAHYTRI